MIRKNFVIGCQPVVGGAVIRVLYDIMLNVYPGGWIIRNPDIP